MPSILHKLKDTYFLWFTYYNKLPKEHRFTLGQRIDDIFISTISAVATASFTPKQDKLPAIAQAIRHLDVIRVLLMVLWETGSLFEPYYIALSKKVEVVGRMLGGWQLNIQSLNKNSPSVLSPEET